MSAFGLDEYDSEARWYYPAIMRTTTMDPLCEKYYDISPYAWCNNNPVNCIDPDGRKIEFAFGCSEDFKAAYTANIQRLNNAGVGCIFEALEASDITYYIADGTGRPQGKGSGFNDENRTITWIPDQEMLTSEEVTLSSATILNHEGAHALLYDEACKNGTIEQYRADKKKGSDVDYDSVNERIVITVYEQETAEALNEVSFGQPTRRDHNGTPIIKIQEVIVIPN